MKKLIVSILAIAAALSGCGGYNQKDCRDSVVKDVGTDDVAETSPYHYVARDSKGRVFYYETMNVSNTEVTKKTLLLSEAK